MLILLATILGIEASAQTTNPPGQSDLPVTRTIAIASSPNASKADYVANGKNDDRVINQALASLPSTGGRVVLLEGTYNLSATIILFSNVSLMGSDGVTQLVLTNSANTVAITNSEPVTGNQGITIENIRIQGNKAFQSFGSGIYFRRVTASLLSNIEVREAKNSGIDLLSGSNGNTLKNIRVLSNGNNGLVISDSSHNKVSSLLAKGNGDSGLWIVNGEQNVLSDIYIFDNKFSRIEIQASNNSLTCIISANNAHSGVYLTQASGNYLQGLAHLNASAGFALNNSRGNTLQVWAVANGSHGIDLYNSSLNIIVNSIARNNGWTGAGYSGIQISDDGLQASNYNMIISNYAWDDQTPKTQEFGIRIAGVADYTLITGNTLKDNRYGPLNAEKRHNVVLNNTPNIP